MKKFEYKAIQLKSSSSWSLKISEKQIEDVLNKNGQEGWELVSIVDIISRGTTLGYLMSFKREL